MIEITTPEGTPPSAGPDRAIVPAMLHGARSTCPRCAKGSLFTSYLKVAPSCPTCGEELHHHRADDAPPYFTMLIVAHIIVGGLLALETAFAPPTWVQLAIWLPALVLLSLWMLPRVKGALIGLQWALRMHGFGGPVTEPDDHGHR